MRVQVAGLCFTDAEGVEFHHDFGLAALSYLIAVAGSYAALEMIERWRNTSGVQAQRWQLASAVTLGGSIWSMHFIAMLALKIDLPLSYSPGLTVLSLAIAIGAVWCGLQILRAHASRTGICCTGVMVGIGIAAMHYVGMAALRFPGTLGYIPSLWALSVVVGIVAAIAALWLSLTLNESWQRASAALIMGAAVCGMHYLGMAAAIFQYDPAIAYVPGVARGELVVAVACTTLTLIVCALVFVATDRRLLASTLREAETLRQSNATLARLNTDLDVGRQRLGAVLDNMSQGLCFFDGTQRLLVWNRRYTEIYGLPPEQIHAGQSLEEIVNLRVAAGTTPAGPPEDYLRWREHIAASGELSKTVVTLRNGRAISIYHHPMPGGGWVATHEDVTERQQAEARIAFMARHDALTRLPNRVLFHERLEQAVEMTGRGVPCSLLCLDLDHFKLVNDTLGHPIGDALLRAAADRMVACIREVDILARLGGDEFAIIQFDVGRPDDASLLARRIIAELTRPFDIEGHHIAIGASIGVAMAPGDGTSSGKLIKSADLALYLAKAEGRGTVRFFEPEMDARIQRRRTLELDLRNAVATGGLEVYYQPQIDLATRRIAEFEALLRWRHPVRGLVPPSEFIPLAEEIGLIVTIGEWVLRVACCDAQSWPDDIKIAVNVSPIQLRKPGLVDAVQAALAVSGLRPDRLELEITESVLLHDTPTTMSTLHRLKDIGVTFALDDFGTGYSSLGYLRNFPFDKIKIDQSFVRDLLKNNEAMSIVRAVTNLGHSLSVTTTAEGVETLEQLDKLRDEGCTTVQGFLFSPARPANEIAGVIERFNPVNEDAV